MRRRKGRGEKRGEGEGGGGKVGGGGGGGGGNVLGILLDKKVSIRSYFKGQVRPCAFGLLQLQE